MITAKLKEPEKITAQVDPVVVQSGGGIGVEKDPTVPAWAKQPNKPTYTAEEVGARPKDWMPTAEDVGALPSDTKIPSKPEDVGAMPANTKIPSTAAEVGALPKDTKPADIGAQPAGNYALKSDIPTIPTIPTKLPNPNSLTFTGAVSGTYDGSAPLTLDIPAGGGGGGTGGGGEWTKLGDITVSDTYEFNPISFTGGVVTLDTSAEGYSFMNQKRNVLFHPIDITSNIKPSLLQLRPKDYAAGTFNVYNLDGQEQTSASMDLTKYKMSVPNIGAVEMTGVLDYDRYKVRFTFPAVSTHGVRPVFNGNVGKLAFGACTSVNRAGGVILEHELFTFPDDPNYMVRRSTIVLGDFYGMGVNATYEAVTIVPSGAGKTHPVNGEVSFRIESCPFVNGSRFELWGANDV